MQQIDSEIKHFRHEEEIERLRSEVRYLTRMSKLGWMLTPIALVLMFTFLWVRSDKIPGGTFRTDSSPPYAQLSSGQLWVQTGAATYLDLTTYPTPGLVLRDGPNPYRIAVVRGKLVAESTDRNGKASIKVLLDNGDADRLSQP